MDLVHNLDRIGSLSFIVVGALAWTIYTSGLFAHRWLSKSAGHPIPPMNPGRHIP